MKESFTAKKLAATRVLEFNPRATKGGIFLCDVGISHKLISSIEFEERLDINECGCPIIPGGLEEIRNPEIKAMLGIENKAQRVFWMFGMFGGSNDDEEEGFSFRAMEPKLAPALGIIVIWPNLPSGIGLGPVTGMGVAANIDAIHVRYDQVEVGSSNWLKLMYPRVTSVNCTLYVIQSRWKEHPELLSSAISRMAQYNYEYSIELGEAAHFKYLQVQDDMRNVFEKELKKFSSETLSQVTVDLEADGYYLADSSFLFWSRYLPDQMEHALTFLSEVEFRNSLGDLAKVAQLASGRDAFIPNWHLDIPS